MVESAKLLMDKTLERRRGEVVRDEAERRRIITYVLNNPVKAGLIDNPEDWSYSSANPKWK